jgi:hypothetical protein
MILSACGPSESSYRPKRGEEGPPPDPTSGGVDGGIVTTSRVGSGVQHVTPANPATLLPSRSPHADAHRCAIRSKRVRDAVRVGGWVWASRTPSMPLAPFASVAKESSLRGWWLRRDSVSRLQLAETTALAGAPWWGVLLVVVAGQGITYGVVCWLATHSDAKRIKTLLITWEASVEPQAEDSDQE